MAAMDVKCTSTKNMETLLSSNMATISFILEHVMSAILMMDKLINNLIACGYCYDEMKCGYKFTFLTTCT